MNAPDNVRLGWSVHPFRVGQDLAYDFTFPPFSQPSIAPSVY